MWFFLQWCTLPTAQRSSFARPDISFVQHAWTCVQTKDCCASVIEGLTQPRRKRQRRRLLNFQLPVFNFLVCITHLFIFDFTWSCMNMKIWNFYFGAERRSKGFLLCCSRSQKTTRLSFLCPVSKEDDGKVTSWLHSHMTSLYSVIDHGTVCVAILDVGQSRQKLQQMYVILFKFQRR